MSIISDPYTTFKNQALRIWKTKDYANRLAFNNTQWFLALMWSIMFVSIIDILLTLVIGDLFTLAKYWSHAWYIPLAEEVYFGLFAVRMAVIWFVISPKLIRFELLVWRGYNQREKRFFEFLEGKIKQRFPNFKTSAQRARERLEKPKKEPSKTKKWLDSRPPIERNLIRVGMFVGVYLIIGSFAFFAFGWDEVLFDCEFSFRTGECVPIEKPTIEEMLDKLEELEEKLPPEKPDGRPPPTIYDIFISKSNPVNP